MQPNNKQARRLAEFYENKVVLITGATGFIGKVCLLKLMASLGNCQKVYIMLRSKKGLTPQQRFNKMLQEAPFNRDLMTFDHFPNAQEMRERYGKQSILANPIDWSKVEAVEGDMSRERLGVSEQVAAEWCKSINIIFNIAASVKFEAPLKRSFADNYLGVRNLLELAMKFKALISLVHVSTFYTNSHMSHVEEKVLPLSDDCEQIAKFIMSTPEPQLQRMATTIMDKRPNAYIFTKAMAENLVQKYDGVLPIAILRPSIVVIARREPEPGWVDSVNGPMGLGAVASLGLLRTIDWNYWAVCDFIPVDYVVNSMLAIAERTPRLYPNQIKVYNCSTSSLNPLTYGACFTSLREESMKVPPIKMLRIPIEPPKHNRANKIVFKMTQMSEILFALLIDLILTICGQKRMLMRLTARVHRTCKVLLPFITNEYTCSNDNLVGAFEELDDRDKVEFDFDVRSIDWDEMFRVGTYGTRKRLLKEDYSNVQWALFKAKIISLFEFLIKIASYCSIAWICYRFLHNQAANSYPIPQRN